MISMKKMLDLWLFMSVVGTNAGNVLSDILTVKARSHRHRETSNEKSDEAVTLPLRNKKR